MIYKFNNGDTVTEIYKESDYVIIKNTFTCEEGQSLVAQSFDSEQLYDLIGVLHSLKGKLNKHEKEGRNE